ncbi:MAG: MCE family protein [Actinomycetota bacterium]|nr:MCE family protein [Actinomycetota bacterium]
MSKSMIRTLVATVIVAVVVVAGVYLLTGGSSKTINASFRSGVGVYPGTPVKVLGIQVGSVTKVTPQGGSVKVEMSYGSSYKVPANASAYIVANSLVSDRYIQLSPAYVGGPVTPSGGTIPLERTASPAELDDIFNALNTLSVTLGPNGANKNGALSTLVNVGAANLNGNGAALASSIKNLSLAATTLANGSTDLFGTVTNLRNFTDALSQSDAQVRSFNSLLATVANDLSNERADLGGALHNLSIALNSVASFVKANAAATHTDIVGLENITGVLVKDQAALNEALVAGPIALSNLTHAYQEQTGTLGTRSNLAGLTTPAGLAGQICDLFHAVAGDALTQGLLQGLLGNLFSGLFTTCAKITGGSTAAASTNNLSGLTNGLTGSLPGTGGGG